MKGYRIKTVSRVTGLSPELLRAWERRHGIVSPRRTAGGYREYSEKDVERLRLLAQLTSHGYSIGEVAKLPLEELAELHDRNAGTTTGEPAPEVLAAPQQGTVDRLVGRADAGDALGFRRALRRVLLLLPGREAVDAVLLPVLQELVLREEPGSRLPALTLATMEIGGYLGPLADEAPADGPLAVVVAGDDGAQSGSRPLLAALSCLRRGWRIVPAGRLLTATTMSAAARNAGATAALICLAEPPSASGLLGLLDAWEREAPPDCTLVIVGAEAGLQARAAAERGARTARDHVDLPTALRAIEPVDD